MIIFDIGPQLPVPPVKPQVLVDAAKLSPGAHGDPRIEPELRRYTEACRNHLLAVDAFPSERAVWERESGGGAIEIACDSVSGGEMLERDPERYLTKLPDGVKLGSSSGTNRVRHSTEVAAR